MCSSCVPLVFQHHKTWEWYLHDSISTRRTLSHARRRCAAYVPRACASYRERNRTEQNAAHNHAQVSCLSSCLSFELPSTLTQQCPPSPCIPPSSPRATPVPLRHRGTKQMNGTEPGRPWSRALGLTCQRGHHMVEGEGGGDPACVCCSCSSTVTCSCVCCSCSSDGVSAGAEATATAAASEIAAETLAAASKTCSDGDPWHWRFGSGSSFLDYSRTVCSCSMSR